MKSAAITRPYVDHDDDADVDHDDLHDDHDRSSVMTDGNTDADAEADDDVSRCLEVLTDALLDHASRAVITGTFGLETSLNHRDRDFTSS